MPEARTHPGPALPASAPAERAEPRFRLRDYALLLKPRVMSLVVFTAMVGLVLAPGQPSPFVAVIAVLCIALGAGAAGAINMWYDRDIDQVMARTRNRPLPAGRLQPVEALAFGIVLSAAAVAAMAVFVNGVAAGLLALTIAYYVLIYTVWLKRRTPQNIVIGGAAGAFPPMIGWVAATGSVSVEAVLMFMLIFMWTPPHFWALALFMKSDYGDAKVPMLTETHGRKATRAHVWWYTVALAPFALALGFTPVGGTVYLAAAVVLNALFLRGAWRIWRRDEAMAEADSYRIEKQVFRFSLIYLFLHFVALLVEAALRAMGV